MKLLIIILSLSFKSISVESREATLNYFSDDNFECDFITEIDLSKSTLQNLISTKQETNTCYAHAAKTLIKSYVNIDMNISHLSIALAYKNSKDSLNSLNTGSTCSAINSTLGKNICSSKIDNKSFARIQKKITQLYNFDLDRYNANEEEIVHSLKLKFKDLDTMTNNMIFFDDPYIMRSIYKEVISRIEYNELKKIINEHKSVFIFSPEERENTVNKLFKRLEVDKTNFQNELERVMSSVESYNNVNLDNVLKALDIKQVTFTLSLFELMKEMNNLNIDFNNLFKDGLLRSYNDIYDSIINDRSSCIKFNFQHNICHEYQLSYISKFKNKKNKILNKIYKSLEDGLAVGMNDRDHAISIIGIRFNNQNNRCELKVLDSNYTKPFWTKSEIIERQLIFSNLVN